MLNHSRLYSIIFNKCPRCHQGRFFVHDNAYRPLREFDKMHLHCPHCGQSLMPEPGFYYGAMYLSYGLYVAVVLLSSLVGIRWLDMEIGEFIMWLLPVILLLTPVFFRMARRTWLTIFVPYDPEKRGKAHNPS